MSYEQLAGKRLLVVESCLIFLEVAGMILFGIFIPQLMIEVMIQWTVSVRN
jgi:hypothetical protein